MANTKVPPRTRLLFLGTSASPTDMVACITQIGTSESANDINADSFCGNDSLPGTKTATITVSGQFLETPSSTYKSYKALHDWFAAQTGLYFLIARATPATGDVEQSGQCFVQQLSSSDDLNAPTTFTATLKIDGDMTVSVHA